MTPVISIIICTRNRAETLRATLASIGRCEVPADMPAELLVVDNGSTDHTPEVVAAAAAQNMLVRYYLEVAPGQCCARNRGLIEANGEVILFTDDDVRVPLNWIECMCRPIVTGLADAVAGGVRIPDHLERSWLRGFLRTMVACTDQGTDHNLGLIGANMGFGRHVLDRIPSFDTELGPGALGYGDESLFSFQLKKYGFRLLDNRQVAVEHHFDEGRLTLRSFMDIAKRMGRSRGYIDYHWEHVPHRATRVRELFLQCKLFLRRLLGLRFRANRSPALWELAYVSRIHLLRQFRRERVRHRLYDRHGLVKIGSHRPTQLLKDSRARSNCGDDGIRSLSRVLK